MSSFLLISPPVTKPCEPPSGVTKLAGALKRAGVVCHVLDANLEGMLELVRSPRPLPTGTWDRRALRNRERNLAALRETSTYGAQDRYRRAVTDVNRTLTLAGRAAGVRLSLCDFDARGPSPLAVSDLMRAAEHPEGNPFFSYFERRLPPLITGQGFTTVGISLTYLSQAFTTFAMAGFLRRVFPGLRLVLGGGLVTSWMRSPGWQDPFAGLFDYCVAGPGEKFLVGLTGASDPGSDAPPDFDGLPLDAYLSPGRVLPYSASTGCYWMRCSFCPERAEENAYLPVAPSLAARHLSDLTRRYRPALLHITDNALSPALMRSIAAQPPGAPWYGFARVTPELAEPGFCRALAASGCVTLKLGVESGSQQVLDGLCKGTDVELVSRVLRTVTTAGIATYVYLLFGTPAETEQEARETLRFVVEHAEHIGFLNVAVFNLPLNSPDTAGLETSRFYPGDLSLYTDFVHPRGWDRRHVRRFLDTEFQRHPAIQPILRRNPRFFTSNHAPFMVLNRPGQEQTARRR